MRGEFVDPGALRVELAVEELSTVGDGLGGFAETWTEVATTFARIEPLEATGRFGADRRLVEVTHRVTMRHRPDLTRTMRLRRNARIFTIVTIHDPDETARYLVCLVQEEGR